MLVVCSSYKIYLLYFILHQLEIYDPVEQSQDNLKGNEEEVTGFEQKVSTARKFVWGWTTTIQVQTCSVV